MKFHMVNIDNRRRFLMVIVLPLLFSLFIVYQKHHLLKFPKIGFVLYSLAGGPIPAVSLDIYFGLWNLQRELTKHEKKFIDNQIFEQEKEWLRSGDVLLSVPAKSGTTWTMYTLHQIRNKGKVADFRDIYEEIPWAEFVHYPGESLHDRVKHLNQITDRHSDMRMIKSHIPPPVLPFRDDVKYLVIIRNPFDVIASCREFFANHGKKFADMWGGFPPGAGEDVLTPEDEWEQMVLRDSGDGKPLAETFVLDFVSNWWPYRNHSNVLILHYSDRIKDDITQINRLASFLNVTLTIEELQRVAEQVSFKETKKVQDKLELRYLLEPFKERGLVAKDVFPLRTDREGTMVNQGPKRKGTEQLSSKMREGVTEMMNKKYPPAMIEWIMNGGRLPVEADVLPPSY